MSFELLNKNKNFLDKELILSFKNILDTNDNIHIENLNKQIVTNKEKMRCNECNCKINITNSLKCKCEKILCMKHRMFNAHNCSIDYKTNDRKILEKNNPKIISDKIISI